MLKKLSFLSIALLTSHIFADIGYDNAAQSVASTQWLQYERNVANELITPSQRAQIQQNHIKQVQNQLKELSTYPKRLQPLIRSHPYNWHLLVYELQSFASHYNQLHLFNKILKSMTSTQQKTYKKLTQNSHNMPQYLWNRN